MICIIVGNIIMKRKGVLEIVFFVKYKLMACFFLLIC